MTDAMCQLFCDRPGDWVLIPIGIVFLLACAYAIWRNK